VTQGNPWGLTPREVAALKAAKAHARQPEAARSLGVSVPSLQSLLGSAYAKMRAVEPDDGHRIALWTCAERLRRWEAEGV
jgi:predicted DNA-binding protein (UPF0251 family)